MLLNGPLIERFIQLKPNKLLLYGVMTSMILSLFFSVPFSLVFHGYVAYDYLFTGLIASGLGSLLVLYVLVALIQKIVYEQAKTFEYESYYRLLFQSIKDCVCIISTEGKFLEVNHTMCKINGYNSLTEPIGTDFLQGVVDDPCKLRSALERAAKGHTVHIEYSSLNKDKEVVWWDSVFSPILEPDGSIKKVLRISREITEKKQIEQRLKENLTELKRIRTASLNIMEDLQHEIAERKRAEGLLIEKTNYLDSILRSSNIAIAATDLDFRIKYYNPVAEEIFGYKAEEVIGKTVMEMHTRERVDPSRFERAIQIVKKEGKYEYEVEQQRDGEVRIIESVVSGILDKDKDLIGYLLFSVDATKRRQMEQELRELNEELQKRVAEEVEKQRQQEQLLIHQSRFAAMGEMIGAIAHQWRQPLNAVGLIVQDFKDAYEYGELNAQYLERQVNQAMSLIQRMSRTIDDFRNFFRPDKERQYFDIKETFKAALSIISPQLKARGIEWSLACKAHNRTFNDLESILICGEHVVYGYKNELEHCVLNIINNARDAFEEIRAVEPKITIETDKEGDMVVAIIRDNAGGIPEGIIGRVFDPYFTTKEEGKGTGIGLYMAKMIVERNMGGRLTARNTTDGAEFRIELPTTPPRKFTNKSIC